VNKLLKAHSAILTANIIYGVNFLIVKDIVPGFMHPIGLTVLRSVGATLLLWAFSLFIKSEKIEKGDMWKLVVSGIIGVTINQTLLILGLNYTSSVNASIIMTSNPIFVMLISALFLKYPITPIKFIGVLLGASGALLVITSNGEFSFDSDTFLGDIITLSNAILYGAYLVWTKPLMQKYNPMTVMKWSFLYGAAIVLLIGWNSLAITDFQAIPSQIYWYITFVVVGATFLTYLLNIIGLKDLNPTTVSIYVYIQPIIVAIVVAYMGKDSFDLMKLMAMVLVFIGVYMVNRSNIKQSFSKNK
jgi:drug/metabolite transporter (DMT)-like permease